VHPTHLKQYTELTSGAKKQYTIVGDEPPAEMKAKQPSIVSVTTSANLVGQATVDKLITDVVVHSI
jgi:hypothetical protein